MPGPRRPFKRDTVDLATVATEGAGEVFSQWFDSLPVYLLYFFVLCILCFSYVQINLINFNLGRVSLLTQKKYLSGSKRL